MAFDSKNLVQLSAGETSPDQLGAQKIFGYESADDLLQLMLLPGYFDSLAHLVRYGSLFILTDSSPDSDVYQVVSDNPTADIVDLNLFALPVPDVWYETLGEVAATFVTSGGISDVYTNTAIDDTTVDSYANFSLNSTITDIAPPFAHAGVEHIQCEAGQVRIFWSRPVLPGQTVKMWLQIRAGTPSP